MTSEAIGAPLASFERIETCFAILYRNSSEIFKLRKPVKLRLGNEWVDLSCLAGRRAACLDEERINRRLSPDVALGVLAVTRGQDGRLRFGADGEIVDWALRMRRLRDADRADRHLAAGTLSAHHLWIVAHRLAALHECAKRQPIEASPAVIDRLRAQIELRIDAGETSSGPPLPDTVSKIEAWQLGFLEDHPERFFRRAASDSIREGHGEVSLEHVFLDDAGRVEILAGLEMGLGLRDSDVVADVALLMADLGARHRVDLAESFAAEYARILNDFDFYPLLDFYASLRASQRGKLDWFCANREKKDLHRAEDYRTRARQSFRLALAAPRCSLLPPVVVAMGGQVASGKTTVARHIAQRIGAPVVGSDATRDFLLGARVDPGLHEARWEEAYEPGFAARVYEEVLRRAQAVLSSGRPVVIDGCFHSRRERAQARDLATRFGLPFLFVEARVADDVQRARLSERASRDSVRLDAWKEIADRLRAQWEPANELPADQYLDVDTAIPLERNTALIESRLPTWPDELTG